MSTDLKESLEILKSSEEFKTWYKNNEKSFLSSCFTIIEDIKGGIINWEIGYYSPKEDVMTSFLVTKDKILIKKDQNILRKKGYKIEKLYISEVNTEINKILKEIEEKHPDEKAVKIIIILQKMGSTNWNITFITEKFNILNVKVDSKYGKILHEEIKPIASFTSKR